MIFALLLMTIASAWAGSQQWLLTVYMVLIIALIDSTRVFRLARAVGQSIVVMDYVEAAKLRGEGLGYLIFREMLLQILRMGPLGTGLTITTFIIIMFPIAIYNGDSNIFFTKTYEKATNLRHFKF